MIPEHPAKLQRVYCEKVIFNQRSCEWANEAGDPNHELDLQLARAEYQLEQQKILTNIITQIRDSLDLNIIFKTTMQEICQLIQADRVAAFRVNPDWSIEIIAEFVTPNWVKLIDTNSATNGKSDGRENWEVSYLKEIQERLKEMQGRRYQSYEAFIVEDIHNADLSPCHIELLKQLQAYSFAIAPIFSQQKPWGLLAAYQHSRPRARQESDIHVLTQIAHQFGIAVQQTEVLSALQLEIAARRQLEQEREDLLAREQAARQQAETDSRMKDEFLAVVSHELRSPLTSILGWTAILRSRKVDEAKTTQALETIERSARSQIKLVDDLLDISRIIRGQLRVRFLPVNLDKVVETAINVLQPAADAKNIQLHLTPTTTTHRVSGDAERLQQVIWNLLSNAIKFTPPGGRVQIQLVESEGQVAVIVMDTGQGIKPDFLPYVFDRFRQADSSMSRSSNGLGLGLAIVHQLVELHGGVVMAESPGEGLGSTFTIKLPLIQQS